MRHEITRVISRCPFKSVRSRRRARIAPSRRVDFNQFRAAILVSAPFLAACGGSEPTPPTQAQITTSAPTTTWRGELGELGQQSGSGASAVLVIGDGRQCAVITKTGIGSLTLRVGEDSESTGNHEFAEVVTACGTGPLR